MNESTPAEDFKLPPLKPGELAMLEMLEEFLAYSIRTGVHGVLDHLRQLIKSQKGNAA